MKISTFSSILAVSLSLSGAHAGFFDFLDDVPAAGEVYQQLTCDDEEIRSQYSCNLAPFKGVFVCRQFVSFLGATVEASVCVRDVADGVTLALEADTCGPCEGIVPKTCGCGCGKQLEDGTYGSSYVQPLLWGETKGPKVCLTNGMVSHATAFSNRIQCVEVCEEEEEEEAEVEEEILEAEATAGPSSTEAPTSTTFG